MKIKNISHNLLMDGAYSLSPRLEYKVENLNSNYPCCIRGDYFG